MSTSTNGHISYGILLDEDFEPPWEDDIEDWWRKETGYVAAHPLPVEMVNTCSGDCPIWIVAVPGTLLEARRGYPEKFEPHTMAVDATALIAFRAFCAKYGIAGEPAWYLGSYYG